MNNFQKNGLANLIIDGDKVNPMLTDLPVKIVDGVVTSVKLNVELRTWNVKITIDKIKLVMYLDDHSHFKKKENTSQFEVRVYNKGHRKRS